MNCVCVEAMFPLGYSQPVAEHGRGTVLAHSCGTLDSSNGNFGFETIFSLFERFLELLCSLWRVLPNPPSFFLSSQSVRLALWSEGTPCLLWLLLLYLSQPFPPINLLHILPYVELCFSEDSDYNITACFLLKLHGLHGLTRGSACSTSSLLRTQVGWDLYQLDHWWWSWQEEWNMPKSVHLEVTRITSIHLSLAKASLMAMLNFKGQENKIITCDGKEGTQIIEMSEWQPKSLFSAV